jgi:septal ring factor EnvC (AmiA/AmiB activator)
MKRFVFSLASVLQLRRQQLEIERARLASLNAQLRQVEAERAAHDAQLAETREQMRNSPYLRSEELASLNEYELRSRKNSERLNAERSRLEKQLDAQRALALGAERNVKILEKSERKQRATWEAECSREIESMAGDFFNARLLAARRSKLTTKHRMSDDSKVSPPW